VWNYIREPQGLITKERPILKRRMVREPSLEARLIPKLTSCSAFESNNISGQQRIKTSYKKRPHISHKIREILYELTSSSSSIFGAK
jgi:hypothetical protein